MYAPCAAAPPRAWWSGASRTEFCLQKKRQRCLALFLQVRQGRCAGLIFAVTLGCYALGLLMAAVGSRLAGRCATWCCMVCGLPQWVVSGTVVGFCVVLPQLMLAFLAAGLSTTALAVGSALAGAVTDLGLVFALCLLRRDVVADRGELCFKTLLLALSCLVLLLFVRNGALSYTGTGLLMLLFVVFVLENIVYCHRATYNEDLFLIGEDAPAAVAARHSPGQDAATVRFPAMNLRSSLKNLAGAAGGLALLAVGAWALVYGAVVMANTTGTIQALWVATLISLGFCLPLLAEVFRHPLGSVWRRFAESCRIYPPSVLPMQILNNAVLSITLVLPVSSLMYRDKLPIGAQYRSYEVPACLALSLLLLLPPLLKKRLYRWQGAVCLAFYLLYLAAVVLAPRAGA